MRVRFDWRRWMVLAVAAAAPVAGGCVPDTFSRVKLGAMGHRAVGELLGPQAEATPEGYSVDAHNKWPTVISLLHVAVPQDKAALWKLEMRGSVVHMISFQTLDLRVVYEGPLSEELLKGLRAPEPDDENEFLCDLVGFVEHRVRDSLTARWKDPSALRDDRYRSRFLGVFDVCMADLRGHGRLHRTRFNVDVGGASPSALRLRYLGHDVYRVEMSGLVSLAPFPVL